MGKKIKTRTCFSFVGSDYSAQEPRSLASFAHDIDMLQAYAEGQDLYALIGSFCFHNNYEDNLEFKPTLVDCTPFKETIDSKDNKFSVLLTDSITLAGNVQKCAKDLVVGDSIITDEGIKQISQVNFSGVNVDITI